MLSFEYMTININLHKFTIINAEKKNAHTLNTIWRSCVVEKLMKIESLFEF